MRRTLTLLLLLAAAGPAADVQTLTLREAVARALRQNPDLIMARLDEQEAVQQIRVARDPFVPKVFAGSGLAYSSGFPMSIEGSAPSIVEARAVASIINRAQRHRLAQAKEEAKGAGLTTRSKRDQIVLRTVELYLEAAHAAKTAKVVRSQIKGLEKVAEVTRVRASEGRELPIAVKRAELDVAKARQRAEIFASELEYAESRLAAVLGFDPGTRVRPVMEEQSRPALPDSEEAALRSALDSNPEIRRLESSITAKGFQVKAERAARLPRLNLVAQYGLFSKFNNYEDFFRKFQRHNGQIGISLEVPLYTGPAAKARRAQAEIEAERLRARLASTRNRIALETRKAYQDVRQAETAVEVARLDLEVARENLGVLLARLEEGRASLTEVEAARYVENEKWIAFYDAHHALELARYELLERTGGLLAALGVK